MTVPAEVEHPAPVPGLDPELILSAVAAVTGVPRPCILGPSRSPGPVLARQVAMYLHRHLLSLSLSTIAANFGREDHTTVMHALRRVDGNDARRETAEICRVVLIEMLRGRAWQQWVWPSCAEPGESVPPPHPAAPECCSACGDLLLAHSPLRGCVACQLRDDKRPVRDSKHP